MITFARPWWLLIIIPAAAVVIVPMVRQGSGRREWPVAALRLLALAALAGALAGASARSTSSGAAACILVDVSESVGDLEAVARLAGHVEAAVPEELPVAVAAFAGDFRVVRPLGEPPGALRLSEIAPGLRPARTDISAALGRAAAVLPQGTARLLVLISDGRENSRGRSAEATASRLGASGVKVITLPAPDPGPGDLFVQDIDLPGRVSAGRPFSVTVTVAGTSPGTAQVVLRRTPGGDVVSRREVDLRWGESARVVFRDRAKGRGFVTYAAEVLSAEDPAPANNAASAGLWVEGPSKVLLVRPAGGAASAAAALLGSRAGASFEVVENAIARWAPSPSDLEGFSVVVLENAGENLLGEAAQKRLVSFVVGRGGGLLVLGGPRAFGAGGLTDESPLAAVLPVSLEPPDTRRAHAVFCLDLSESMAASAGPVDGARSKFDFAREAVAWAAGALGETDAISVVTFSESASAPVTKMPAGDSKRLENALRKMRPAGGTDLLAGVKLSAALLKEVEAEAKHIVLLSDGEPTRGGPDVGDALVEVAREIARSGGKLDVVGADPDKKHAELLGMMAAAGKGALHLEARPERLRDHFRRIVLAKTREFVRAESFRPKATSEHPVTRDLGPPPLIDTRNRVSPLPGSTDIWSVPGETPEPVLSVCRRGMGRSAVLATGLHEGWAGEMASWRERANLLGRLVRWCEAEPGDHSVTAAAVESATGTRLLVTVRTRSGETLDGAELTAELDCAAWKSPVTTRMVQTGLGRYRSESSLRATTAAREPVRVALRELAPAGEGKLLGRTTLKALPPEELTRLGSDRVLLGRAAEVSGASLTESAGEAADEVRRLSEEASAAARRPLAGPLAIAALLVFLLELGLRAIRRPGGQAAAV